MGLPQKAQHRGRVGYTKTILFGVQSELLGWMGYTGKHDKSQTPQPTVWLVLEGETLPFKATGVKSPHTCWLISQW